ncbi:DUF4268 domain-containing protein [Mesorhizobium sp. AR10]|uniref:DUF4268 domain-containing protein n=1 Tax=Mesorhizobium sp. AR10 TaxID=2865839 RepID=UPI00215F43CD|nr:DUF4268 domain-containing protein [Mesorhizobium sp. AR10]UVK41217.1 DUF4268 domain-containing protein [Mesorhizobium sp. AR10]
MPIYSFGESDLTELTRTTFAEQGIGERKNLQALIRDHVSVISPDTLVIAEEFSEWSGSGRRIDLLGVSKDASLVVVELKRTETGEHMELQALRYAAMVSTLTYKRAIQVYADYIRKRGLERDAERDLLDFLGWGEPRESEFAQDVRIVLASADFSQELTTTVMWLIEREIEIRCVRLIPYSFQGKLLLDVQQVIPLPEAEAYQVKIREQSEERREAKRGEERYRLREEFWRELLERAKAQTPLHANLSPTSDTWVQTGAGVSGLAYAYRIRQHDCEVGLAIERRNAGENKKIFDQLLEAKDQIEASFGDSLDWDWDEARGSCHLRRISNVGGYRDAEQRLEVQAWMIDHMMRLEKAVAPHIRAAPGKVGRRGGAPEV